MNKGRKFDYLEYVKSPRTGIALLIYPDGSAEYLDSKYTDTYSDCVQMYSRELKYKSINHDQLCTLRQLKSAGIYHGDIPY